MSTYFVTAIDTDIGKTIATGLLAKYLAKQQSVITMKMSQTGCNAISEDIQKHRELMGIPWQVVDEQGQTCPYVFSYPASPHLSAKLEGVSIDVDTIDSSLYKLNSLYDYVLLEGVGGVMVPLTEEVVLIDWLQHKKIPVILVTSGRLGSINHTLLTCEVLKQRNISLHGVIYNQYHDHDHIISSDTRMYLRRYIHSNFNGCKWGELLNTHTCSDTEPLVLDDNFFYKD